MAESASLYSMNDVKAMKRTALDGSDVTGADELNFALDWVCYTTRPKNIFQLTFLNARLVEYHHKFPPDSDFAGKFRWAASHLRRLEFDFYHSIEFRHDFYWSSACELSWRALKLAILNPWVSGDGEVDPYGYGAIDYHKSYELCYYEFQECLTQQWWIVD